MSADRKIVCFFPQNLWPPRTGAHHRCLEMLKALRALECRVTLVSSTLTDTTWTDESVRALTEHVVDAVRIYQPTKEDWRLSEFLVELYDHADHDPDDNVGRIARLGSRFRSITKTVDHEALVHRYLKVATSVESIAANALYRAIGWRLLVFLRATGAARRKPLSSMMHASPGLRKWFSRVVNELSPAVVVMSYARWDSIIDHRELRSITRVIDYLDPMSVSDALQQELSRRFRTHSNQLEPIDESVLSDRFYDSLDIRIADDELAIFDRYDVTIAINASEAEQIRQRTSRTRVRFIPVTLEPRYLTNHYSGPALFPIGPNLFNIQGYLFFIRRVLPKVLAVDPSFALHVTGTSPKDNVLQSAEGVTLRGFVPTLDTLYENCRFMLCPVFGGTGQQIKIVEAMANGLPVVAFKRAAASSPLHHEVNGLVANDEAEFAEQTLRLWSDRQLCKRLGQAARETVASEFSRGQLAKELGAIVRRS